MEDEIYKELINQLKKINLKLSLILGEQIKQNNPSIKEQVATLHKAGLDYNTVAEALGITATHAAKEMSQLKKIKR